MRQILLSWTRRNEKTAAPEQPTAASEARAASPREVTVLDPRATLADLPRYAQATVHRGLLVGEILGLNPSVRTEFLDAFENDELDTYLNRLKIAQRPRGRDTRWVRPQGHRAIEVHERLR